MDHPDGSWDGCFAIDRRSRAYVHDQSLFRIGTLMIISSMQRRTATTGAQFMEKRNIGRLLLFTVLVAGALQVNAAAPDGRIFSLRGSATINGAPLRRSSVVHSGDEIRTTRNARVKAVMSDGTILDIGPSSIWV